MKTFSADTLDQKITPKTPFFINNDLFHRKQGTFDPLRPLASILY